MDEGILAADSISYFNVGEQAGIMISSILAKEKNVVDIPFEISNETNLIVSADAAETLGIEITSSILERAEVR